MLKSGELDTRLTRFGAATGTPPEWPLLGKLWAKIIDPRRQVARPRPVSMQPVRL